MTVKDVIFVISEKKIGYVHNVSPLKRAASKCQWYDFNLQVSPTKSRRIVAFNTQDHKLLKHMEDSKTPAILKDVVIKGDKDWLYTQQSSSEQCPNSEVYFEYNLNLEPEQTTGKSLCVICVIYLFFPSILPREMENGLSYQEWI